MQFTFENSVFSGKLIVQINDNNLLKYSVLIFYKT